MFIVLAATSASAAIGQDLASAASRNTRPGEGVLCMWVLTAAAAEIGRTCRPGERPELQAGLDRAVERFDAYVLANEPGATAESIAAFKRQQGVDGSAASTLCDSELAPLFDHVGAQGIAHWLSQVDRLLSRPGRPGWGDCL
jgi:hypothetical protein